VRRCGICGLSVADRQATVARFPPRPRTAIRRAQLVLGPLVTRSAEEIRAGSWASLSGSASALSGHYKPEVRALDCCSRRHCARARRMGIWLSLRTTTSILIAVKSCCSSPTIRESAALPRSNATAGTANEPRCRCPGCCSARPLSDTIGHVATGRRAWTPRRPPRGTPRRLKRQWWCRPRPDCLPACSCPTLELALPNAGRAGPLRCEA
jgi:hypothetical protein